MYKTKRRHTVMLASLALSGALILSACSLVDQANESLNYVSGASEYINGITSAGAELQELASGAMNNPEMTAQIQEKIDQIQAQASEFSQLSAPAIGESIHENLVSYNDQLTAVVNEWENNIAEQGFTVEQWEQSGIPELISNINQLQGAIEGLSGS